MNRNDLPWIVLALLLLVAGFVIGRQYAVPPFTETERPVVVPERAFRIRFWEDRGLDLAVQIGLILSGALSIAALLPGRRESSE
jgi:hypothetical protein